MSLAAGLAIGYFVYQSIVSNRNGERGRITGRLHKSAKDKKMAGVCAGIAEYLKVDPTIIRLVFAMMVFGWGTGILAYILLAAILPEGDAEEEDEEENEKENAEDDFYPNNQNSGSNF